MYLPRLLGLRVGADGTYEGTRDWVHGFQVEGRTSWYFKNDEPGDDLIGYDIEHWRNRKLTEQREKLRQE